MTDEEFKTKLDALISSMADLAVDRGTKDKLMRQARDIRGQRDRAKQAVEQITESMGLLRIHIQYTMLDLEATKRENRELKNRLQERDEDDS